MSENIEKVTCLIIGSGPAGYTAAIYAARAEMKPVMYQGMQPGGQLTTTNEVENFPGYPDGVTGPEMMIELQKQAERFGTQVRFGMVTKVDFSDYIDDFVLIATNGNFMEALDCLTIIENLEGPFMEENILECQLHLKAYLEKDHPKDDQKAHVLSEIAIKIKEFNEQLID